AARRDLTAMVGDAFLGEAVRGVRRAHVTGGQAAALPSTYNFPQDRITDHRVKVTTHGIESVLAGDLEQFTAALQADEKRRALEEIGRASCRERVEMWGIAGHMTKNGRHGSERLDATAAQR